MPWNSLNSLGATGYVVGFSDPVAVTDSNACLEVYAGQPGELLYVVANSPLELGGGFTGWIPIGAPLPTYPSVDIDASQIAVTREEPDQGLVLFVSVNPGNVFYATQTYVGVGPAWTWGQWAPIGGQGPWLEIGTPAIVYDKDYAINVFAAAGVLLRSIETATGSGQYGAWQDLGGNVPPNYRPAVGVDLDGRLEVFVRNPGGTDVQVNYQNIFGEWSWASLGTPGPGAASDVAVASDGAQAGNRAGCLEVVVVGTDQHLYQISQTVPGNGWGAWADLGGVGAVFQVAGSGSGPVSARPVIASNADGCLEAYLVGAYQNSYAVYRIRQQSPGGAWSGWASLGGPGPAISTNPGVGRIIDPDLLQLFVVGEDGNVYNLGQSSNSTW